MSQSSEEQSECPLCLEAFEVDDLNFFPCTCGYQICRFCWHRIRTNENGLCPACRKGYEENPADFKPLSQEQVAKLKADKRQKEQQKKQKATESRKHLANVRVVQKNLVFVVGLPIRLADPNVLKKHEYFGKFGKIHKVVINQSTSYAGAMGPSASAYVTYSKFDDALRAIQSVNNISVDNRVLKTSLGTTKYCSHFIKSQTCPKPDCMYLHDLGDSEASFTKEEMQQGKHQEYEKKLHEQLNNSMSRDRKQTPSPPLLGTTKEIWPQLLNGTTGVTLTGDTIPTTTITENQTDLTNKQKNKDKIKDKTDNKSSNIKRKGKEKNGDVKVGDDEIKKGLINSRSENSINTRIITSSNHRASLFEPDNNSFFSPSNFTKINTTGIKETVPSSNGFLKLGLPDNLKNNLHKNNECDADTLEKEAKLEPITNGYLSDSPSPSYEPTYNNYQPQQNGDIRNPNLFNNLIVNNPKLKNEDVYHSQSQLQNILGQQNYIIKQHLAQQQNNYQLPQQLVLQQQQQQQNTYPYTDTTVNNYRNLNPQQNGVSQHHNYLQQNHHLPTNNLRDHIMMQNKNNIFGNYGEQEQNGTLENGTYDDKDKNRINDDLDFDPFVETQKAFADLLSQRNQIQQKQQQQQQHQQQQKQHYFDNSLSLFDRSTTQFNMLGLQNQIGSKLLPQFQNQQQMLNANNHRLIGSRLDGSRPTLPPPGFSNPSHSQLNNYDFRSSNTSKVIPGMNAGNRETATYPNHYMQNGISKSNEWPDSLRSLLQENGSNATPSTSFSSSQKSWNSCSDWPALDPAIVSSSRPSQIVNNQDYSQVHHNQFPSQMSQLHLGMLGQHNNWLQRQTDDNLYYKTNWPGTAGPQPPPGFSMRHHSPDMKKPVLDGLE